MTTIRPRFTEEAERLGLAFGGIEIHYIDQHTQKKQEADHQQFLSSLPDSLRSDYEKLFSKSDPLSVVLTHWIRKTDGTPDRRYNPFTRSWPLAEFNELLSCVCGLGYVADGGAPERNKFYEVDHYFDAGPLVITGRGAFLSGWPHRPAYYDGKTWDTFLEQVEALVEIERHLRCLDQGIPSVLREMPLQRKRASPAPRRGSAAQPLWGRIRHLLK